MNSDDADIDVLVVGGGNAALCAALTAREACAWVMLLEAAPRFWRDTESVTAPPAAMANAAVDTLPLRYLDCGHGEGCNETDDRFTAWRRRFHHLTFYGFMLCFASSGVATLYHYALGQAAPYAVISAPVLLGMAGGLGLLDGPAGLLWLHTRRDPRQVDPAHLAMNRGFIALLFLTSMSGLLLLAWRDTRFMGLLLAVHLAIVVALFLTMLYGKFAHGVFRCSALVKNAVEARQKPASGIVEV